MGAKNSTPSSADQASANTVEELPVVNAEMATPSATDTNLGQKTAQARSDTVEHRPVVNAHLATPPATDPTLGQRAAAAVGIFFAALMLTMLMSSLGQMTFGSALPSIVGELGGVDQMSWVISAFLVTMTIAMPLAGQLGDRMGRKWVYITGIAIFVIGSALGGFANSMGILITGRAIQGFGAGIMMISSQSI